MTVVKVPTCLGLRRRDYLHVLRHDPCSYCRARRAGTVDHVHPRAAGGRDRVAEDVVGSCGQCNAAKADGKLLLYLLARL